MSDILAVTFLRLCDLLLSFYEKPYRCDGMF